MSGCPAAAGLRAPYCACLSLGSLTHGRGLTVAPILLTCTHSAWHREGPQGASFPRGPFLSNCAKLTKPNPTLQARPGPPACCLWSILRTTDGALPSTDSQGEGLSSRGGRGGRKASPRG